MLEVDLEDSKELCQFYSDYPLAADKIEIKEKMSSYQLKIADFYNISIGNIKNVVHCSFMRTYNFIWAKD